MDSPPPPEVAPPTEPVKRSPSASVSSIVDAENGLQLSELALNKKDPESVSEKDKAPFLARFGPLPLLKAHWGTAIFVIFSLTLCILGETIDHWNLTWKAWITIATILISFIFLAKSVMLTEWVMLLGMTVFLVVRPKDSIIDLKGALTGFSAESVATVAALYPVAESIHLTGGLDLIMKYFLGEPGGLYSALVRLMIPGTIFSAFINNTPQVSIMIPVVKEWSKRIHVPASKLLIPLSYSTILGGTIAIIGTSVNLTVLGLIQSRDKTFDVNTFEIALVGIPVSIFGIIYIVLVAPWLLPVRIPASTEFASRVREYTIAMAVPPKSAVAGKSIEASDLRHLKGLYLFEVQRNGDIIEAPGSNFVLQENDLLYFTGDLNAVRELWLHDGLQPSNQVSKLSGKGRRFLVEAVINVRSPLIGHTPKDIQFRSKYNAAIIAVHRGGTLVKGKIGEITLQGGDTLMLATTPVFVSANAHNPHFALVAEVRDSDRHTSPRWKLWVALSTLVMMMVFATAEWLPMFAAAMAANFVLIFTRCITFEQAWSSVDMGVTITVAASFALGQALDVTGAARAIAYTLMNICENIGGMGLLFGLYLTTALLSALLSNNATVALVTPIAYEFVLAGRLPIKAVAYTLMFAASADFSTPIGYQTNLMVYSAGGYKFSDFVKIGVPLQFLCMITSVIFIYLVWA